MGIFDGIYFGCDLDGTLLGKKTNDVSESDIKAIEYFKENGGRFGFCTGRLPSEVRVYDAKLHTNAPSVCCNGSLIYDLRDGSSTITKEIGEDIIPFLQYITDEFPKIMIDLSTPETIFYHRPNSSLAVHQRLAVADFRQVEHFSLSGHPWIKLALWGEPEDVLYLTKNVDRSKLPSSYSFLYSLEYCCEITAVGGDKGTALMMAAGLMDGIKTVVAAGDNENDITMLKNAHISFTPANGVKLAKDAAKFTLDSDCDNGAITELIPRLEKIIKDQ